MSETFHLFERYGVELEYMIVQRGSLSILPITDQVLHAITGTYESDADLGELSWSNELVLHVIELKTNGPAETLDGLAGLFQRDVRRINELLAAHEARLMPTAAHPWMDPAAEARLWPHEYNAVYEAFNRIFNCQGHGWSNLQCVHLNLPFADDEEFGRLHAAIRLLLPIMPALAASSPILDGRPTGAADSRLEAYRTNSRRVPSIAGRVIPEPVFTQRDYEERILQPIYRDLAPHDPDGTLQFEWANARGAIARFMRNTIEIRVLDIQECPQADLAILRLIVAALRALSSERWGSYAGQRAWPVEPLERIFLAAVRDADQAVVADAAYLAALGLDDVRRCTAGEVWGHLFERLFTPAERESAELVPLRLILERGCLSRRILRVVGGEPSRERLAAVYGELCACLAAGRQFGG